MSLAGSQDGSSPPGISTDNGIVDAYALVDTHTENLRNHSYTVNYTITERYSNGTLRTSQETTTMVGVSQEQYHSISRVTGNSNAIFGADRGTVKYWSNGTTRLRAIVVDGETTYRELSDSPPTVLKSYDERLYVLFTSSNVSVTKQTTEGGTVYRVHSTEVVQPSLVPRSTELTNVTNVSFSAVVSPEGTIQSYDLSYRATYRDERITVQERLSFTDFDSTTVGTPAWVEAWRNDSGQ
jgi:hypothetical protein